MDADEPEAAQISADVTTGLMYVLNRSTGSVRADLSRLLGVKRLLEPPAGLSVSTERQTN